SFSETGARSRLIGRRLKARRPRRLGPLAVPRVPRAHRRPRDRAEALLFDRPAVHYATAERSVLDPLQGVAHLPELDPVGIGDGELPVLAHVVVALVATVMHVA